MQAQTQKKVTIGFLAVVAIGIVVILAGNAAVSSIPWIHVKTQPDGSGPAPTNAISGNIRYDLKLNYNDGTSDTFSDTYQIRLPYGSIFNQQQGGKQIDSIDLSATLTGLTIPQTSHTLGDTIYVDSIVSAALNNTQLQLTQPTEVFFGTSMAGMDHQLYSIHIRASAITTATGSYILNIQSKDTMRIKVDGVDKTSTITATPKLKMISNGATLQPIYVVTQTAAGVVSLDQNPVYTYYSCVKYDANGQPYNAQCPSLSTYNWFVTVKATGFKPNAPLSINYDEHSYFKFTGHPLYTSKTVQTDNNGNAQDKTNVYNGLNPDCTYYGVNVNLSDGSSNVGPLTVGCLYN